MKKYKETHIADGITKYEINGQRQWLFYAAVVSFIFWFGFFLGTHNSPKYEIISPCPVNGCNVPTETPSITPVQPPSPTITPRKSVRGTASYYSTAGCLGCSETLTMANGETFSDEKLTIALTPETVSQHKLLNDEVRVINVKNGQEITAKVTDTGGFAKYNRIADLGVAVKNAIGCSSLCEVEIVW